MLRFASLSLLLTGLLLTSAGCTTVRSITAPDDENLLSGAGSILKAVPPNGSSATTQGFEELDLDELLRSYGLADPSQVASSHTSRPDEYKYRRNDLQNRLLSASNQRCGAYIRQIVTSKSQTQMGWTSLAALLSGAAAVVPHALTAKAFAAGSTVSTGLLSTYNEAYFNNLAVTVVTSGIAKQRESILSSISSFRTRDLSQYPVNAAIADAIAYHAACNIVVGMEAAAKATAAARTDTFSPLAR